MSYLMSLHHSRRARGDQGMTLLELIVVIVILGILAAIAIPTFLKVIQNSKDASSTETANSLSHDATALAAFAGKGAVSLAANGNSYVYNAAKSDLTSYNFHNAVSGATNDADYPASGTTKGTITEVTTSTWNISVGDPGESCLTATTSVDVVAVATSGSCADYVEIPFGGSGSTTTATGGSTTTTTTPPTALAGLYPSDADTNSPMALNGVACPSEGHCVAVGNYVTAGNAYPLIDTLSGDSWTATTAPLPTNADADGQSASLESISCAADSTCVAVGEYVVGGVQAGLIATFSAGSWTVVEAPVPSDALTSWGYVLTGISCVDSTNCVAVGAYTQSEVGAGIEPYAATLSEGSWTTVAVPLPEAARAITSDNQDYDAADAVACSSATVCVADSVFVGGDGQQHLGIDTLSGGSWSAVAAPEPGGATFSYPGGAQSVSCPADGSCVVVGAYQNGDGTYRALIDSSSGGSWSAQAGPVPTGTGIPSYVASVSCVSTSVCQAAGYYTDSANSQYASVLTLSEGSWSAVQANPIPSDALTDDYGTQIDQLSALACSSPSYCVGAGYYGTLPTSWLAWAVTVP